MAVRQGAVVARGQNIDVAGLGRKRRVRASERESLHRRFSKMLVGWGLRLGTGALACPPTLEMHGKPRVPGLTLFWPLRYLLTT